MCVRSITFPMFLYHLLIVYCVFNQMKHRSHNKFCEAKLGMWICILALNCNAQQLESPKGATLGALDLLAADLKMTPQQLVSTWLKEIGCGAQKDRDIGGVVLKAPLKLPGFRKKRQAPKK
jgi:hypothetical protein